MESHSLKQNLVLVQEDDKRKTGLVMGVDVHKHVLACSLMNEIRILLETSKRNNNAGVTAVIDLCRLFYGGLYLNDVIIREEE